MPRRSEALARVSVRHRARLRRGLAARARTTLLCAAIPVLLGARPAPGQLPAKVVDHAAIERAVAIGPHRRRRRKPEPESGLVSVAWLAAHLRDPDLVLLHVGEEDGYRTSHIPGARYVDFHELAANGHGSGPGLTLEMLPPDELRRQLEELGISDDSRIVVYFGKDWITPSTRVLFTLDAIGLGARAALLDGGMPEWVRAGHPVTAELPAPPARGRIRPNPARRTVVDADFVETHERSPGTALVDARSPVYYDGTEAGSGVRGHIPGAHTIPFTSLVDDSLRVKPREQLEALFRQAGVGAGDTVIAYCHVGMQATAVVFAARLLGHPARLYDGSMQDWAAHKLPVTTAAGDQP